LLEARRRRQVVRLVEEYQVSGDVRLVEGVDDGDRLVPAVAGNGTPVGVAEGDLVEPVGVAHLTRAERRLVQDQVGRPHGGLRDQRGGEARRKVAGFQLLQVRAPGRAGAPVTNTLRAWTRPRHRRDHTRVLQRETGEKKTWHFCEQT